MVPNLNFKSAFLALYLRPTQKRVNINLIFILLNSDHVGVGDMVVKTCQMVHGVKHNQSQNLKDQTSREACIDVQNDTQFRVCQTTGNFILNGSNGNEPQMVSCKICHKDYQQKVSRS